MLWTKPGSTGPVTWTGSGLNHEPRYIHTNPVRTAPATTSAVGSGHAFVGSVSVDLAADRFPPPPFFPRYCRLISSLSLTFSRSSQQPNPSLFMASLRAFLSQPHESNPAPVSRRWAPRRRRPHSPNFGRNCPVTSSSPLRDLFALKESGSRAFLGTYELRRLVLWSLSWWTPINLRL